MAVSAVSCKVALSLSLSSLPLLAVDSADREHEEKCHDFRENGVFGENESKSKINNSTCLA